jgi:fructose 1,6-bisphosphatase
MKITISVFKAAIGSVGGHIARRRVCSKACALM